MKLFKNITVFGLITALLVMSTAVDARDKVANRSVGSSNYVDSSGTFDGNQIYADVTNNGLFLDYHVSGDSALEWPKGTGAHSIFQSALWLGATVNGETRVAIGDYTQDMGPGPWGGDPLAAVHRIYKVEKAMLASPADHADFQEWPVDFGAPWVDVDGDGAYSPLPFGPDHPEFVGDQVLWFVSNDGDPAYKLNMATSPMDVEVQTTMFGFDRPDVFGDMVFLKQLVINKGDNTLEDTYMGLWSDPDLGSASDDLVGCDVPLGLGYVWNEGDDPTYSTLDIGTPAAGYDFFQGPMVPCDTTTLVVDTDGDGTADAPEACPGAKMFGTTHPGMKNLQMSSFAFYINGDDIYRDPSDETEGYNYMQGLRRDGTPYPAEIAGCGDIDTSVTPNVCNTDADGNEILLNDGKYVFSGDPAVAHSLGNPVDGNYASAADRRFLMNTGPFTMAPGDSQEVVFGIFHAAGGGALASVAYLKEVDALAQTAYDIDFALPDSPPSPVVQTASFEKELLLVWDGAAELYNVTSEVDLDANGNPTDFVFEGYNVYQHETAQGAGNTKRLATYDLINGITEIYDDVFNAQLGETINQRVQFGSDSGLEHFISITSDGLNNNKELITNREYYFSVTAYGYNPDGIPKTLESSPVYISLRPEVPNTTTVGETTGSPGTTFAATRIAGPSGGSVTGVIVDPTKISPEEYTITFNDTYDTDGDGTDDINAVTWNAHDSAGNLIFDHVPYIGGVNQITGIDAGPGSGPIHNGVQIQVNGPPLNYITDVSEWDAGSWTPGDDGSSGNLRDPAVGYTPWASLGLTGYIIEHRAGKADGVNQGGAARDHDRFDIWNADDIEFDFSHSSLAWMYHLNNVENYVPFTMYRHNFGTGVKEPMYAAFLDGGGPTSGYDVWTIDCTYDADDVDGDGVINECLLDDDGYPVPLWSGPTYGAPGWDPIYGYVAFDTDGDGARDFYDTTDADGDGVYDSDATYITENNAFVSGGCGWGAWSSVANPDHYLQEWGCPGAYTSVTGAFIDVPLVTATIFTDYLGYGVLPTDAGIATGAYNAQFFTGASSVMMITAKPNTSQDSFLLTVGDWGVVEKEYDVDSIKVWPNPYYGYNPEERDALDRRVMFTHLPEEGPVTVRIFALDGTLVRTMHHNDAGTQHLSWDMKNNYELPVASGMYVAHVETNKGDKILKLAVIQPEQRLDVY